MNATTANPTQDALSTEAKTDNPTAERALDWARRWYPAGSFALTGVTDAEATVLVEVDGDIRIVHYSNLDRGRRCPICGAPLA